MSILDRIEKDNERAKAMGAEYQVVHDIEYLLNRVRSAEQTLVLAGRLKDQGKVLGLVQDYFDRFRG